MLLVMALLVWTALSVVTTLLLGRVFAAAARHTPLPIAARPTVTSGPRLTRS